MIRLILSVSLVFYAMSIEGSGDGTAGRYLGQLTWPEAAEALEEMPIVVLPFAAGAKEHGPHLAMNADQVVMEYLLDAVVETMEVLVAPPILHGWFPAFRDFPGPDVADPAVFQNDASNSRVENVHAISNAGDGIRVYENSLILNSVASSTNTHHFAACGTGRYWRKGYTVRSSNQSYL